MAGIPLSAAAHVSRRRREDAVIAQAEAILFRRLQRRGRLGNPREAERFLRVRLAGLLHEELHAVWLDGHHRIIACDVLAKGASDRAAIDARVVLQLAMQRNARGLILAHNHPSGVAVPSASDVALTGRLREALAMFEVRLLEHFVVGDGAAVAVGSSGAPVRLR
jgi:DNA repair protein RadC